MLSVFLERATDRKPTPIDFSGRWVNQHGSEMDLQVAGEVVSGTYITKVGGDPNTRFDLRGFCSGDLISFTVNFGAHGSLTAWAGQHTVHSGVEQIHTLWHLAHNVTDPEEPKQLWAGVLAGADTFTR